MIEDFISICVPAYKRVIYLERLLNSIEEQTFKSYEIIISDDSPDNVVSDLVSKYSNRLNLKYFHNKEPLGTPANWNAAISKASGKWIKLMHDDDWFNDVNALQKFFDAAQRYPRSSFFFSAYQNVYENSGAIEEVKCSKFDLWMLSLNPLHLYSKNYIGNPSCIFVKNDPELQYDVHLKFAVDFEYYTRYIKTHKEYTYIDEVLLNVGMNDTQVTTYTFLKPDVQIPENHYIIRKSGVSQLKNILFFDYYWRMYRNFSVRKLDDVTAYWHQSIPPALKNMIRIQSKIPVGLLKNGLVSKALMLLAYFYIRIKSL